MLRTTALPPPRVGTAGPVVGAVRLVSALLALVLLPLLAGLTGTAQADAVPAFRNPDLPLSVRVGDLIGRLTLDEKISLLHQYQPAIPRLGIASFRTGTEALHGVAWLGAATVFPQAVGLGSTWDPNLIKQVGSAVGDEARAFHQLDPAANGLNLWAPVVNPLRDPRWGRNEEGYSEDPLLTSRIATAYGHGLQGDDSTYLKTAPTLKHFAAYNVEADRSRVSVSVPPRVLHEYEYKAFQPALADGAATGVMASYNLMNGRPMHVAPELGDVRSWSSKDLMIVGDAGGAGNLSGSQQYYATPAQAAAAAIKAGLDSFTENSADPAPTVAAVNEALSTGLLTSADVDRAVGHILPIRFRLGEFDPPGRNPYEKIGPEAINSRANQELARQAAREQIVLLESEHRQLPLAAAKNRSVAVVGPLADSVQEDWYSGTMPYRITPRAGIAERLGSAGAVTSTEGVDRVALQSVANGKYVTGSADPAGGGLVANAATAGPAEGFDVFDWGGGNVTLRSAANGKYVSLGGGKALVNDQAGPGGWYVQQKFGLERLPNGNQVIRYRGNDAREPWFGPARYVVVGPEGSLKVGAASRDEAAQFSTKVLVDGTAAAVAQAKAADTAVVVVGSTPFVNGREDDDRQDLGLAPAQQRLVRAVTAANPRTIVVLESSYPLTFDWGQHRPSALLWTSHAGQETGHALADVLFGDYSPSGRLPQTWYRSTAELPSNLDYDVIKAGWTYQFHQAKPLYPFGHGLTYGDFQYSNLRAISVGGKVRVSVDVMNSGRVTSDEVVQLYTHQRTSRVEQPLKILRGFQRLSFAPGQRRTVVFEVTASDFASWDVTRNKWAVESSLQDVWVGSSSSDLRARSVVQLNGEKIPPRDLTRSTAATAFDDYSGIRLTDAAKVRGNAVTSTAAGNWIAFHDVRSLRTAHRITASVSRAEAGSARVEVRANRPDGPVLGSFEVPSTSDRYSWTSASGALNTRAAVHDIYLVFGGGGISLRDLRIF